MIYIYFDKIDRKIKLQNLLNEFFFQEIRTVKNKIDIHPFRFKFYTCSIPTLLTNILLALDRAFPQKKKKYIYIFLYRVNEAEDEETERFVGGRGSERGAAGDSWGYSGVGRGFAATLPSLPLLSTALFPGIVLDLRALRRFFFSVAN